MKLRLANLIEDSSFINWAQQADRDATVKWETYLQQNPQQQSLLEEAALIVRGIPFTPQRLHPQVVEQQWQKLQQQLQVPVPVRPLKPAQLLFKEYQYVTLALISILAGGLGYWYSRTR